MSHIMSLMKNSFGRRFGRALLGLLVCMALGASSASAQESWVGKTILVKKSGITIGHTDAAGRQVVLGKLDHVRYRVDGDDGGWIKVNDGRGHSGWFDKADAVLLEDAVAFFTERIRANPSDAGAYNRRAAAWRAKGEIDIALKDQDRVLQLDPSSYAFNNRGLVWNNKKEFDLAIADYNEAIRLDPTYSSAFRNRGLAWRNKKEYDRAIADYNEAIRLDPAYVSTFGSRGIAWSEKKEYDRAIADYNEAIRLDPQYADAYHNRGWAWSQKKEYDRAIADYSEVIRLDPQNSGAYRSRGWVWSQKKEYDRVIAGYNEAIRLDPKNADGLNGLAWLFATCPEQRHRDGQRAVELAKRAVELDPCSNNLDTLAAAYAEAGDFEAAVRWQERAMNNAETRQDVGYRERLELYRSQRPYRETVAGN